ncbi:kinase-like protein [Schizopora paradoxa]|uniref:Kinase-like protein n=1 Tax=Schizopora paradoxa TaxID=27342 RepID=A0A0H2S695_9AGAM|nr:kinase-like protein [Schizopora paradoxa]
MADHLNTGLPELCNSPSADRVPTALPAESPCPPDSSTESDILRRVLGRNPHLNLTGFVEVNPLTPKSDCGGFGDVFKGVYTDPRSGAVIPVAVKRSRVNGDLAKVPKRFAREVKIWSELDHPNVMPLLGYAMEGRYPSFVSRWMEGGSLHMCVPNLNRIEAILMILDIASGLAYMHERKAVHSDVKSDNVLITTDKRAVLTDFGASLMSDLSRGCSSNSCMGTTRWIAPELFPKNYFEPLPKHTIQADVWAFGMTVYELLSRERPYTHVQHDWGLMNCITAGHLPEKPKFSENPIDTCIEEFMWSLCQLCWKFDPKERPTMHKLKDSISEFKKNVQ